MSMATLEREILVEARKVTGKPKLRNKDIMEWSTGEIKPHNGERVFLLPILHVYIAVPIAVVGAA